MYTMNFLVFSRWKVHFKLNISRFIYIRMHKRDYLIMPFSISKGEVQRKAVIFHPPFKMYMWGMCQVIWWAYVQWPVETVSPFPSQFTPSLSPDHFLCFCQVSLLLFFKLRSCRENLQNVLKVTQFQTEFLSCRARHEQLFGEIVFTAKFC